MKNQLRIIAAGISLWLMAGVAAAQTDDTTDAGVQVVESRLCRAVKNRVVEDEDSTFMLNSKVFLWLRTTGGAGSQLTVTWRSGTYEHTTTLLLGGSTWRTWASKIVRVAGEWTATVTDERGTVLEEKRFEVK
ncbi:MAG TPA: DUF2914 domain-containing protein [Bacteroidota bacterium]|jgi:hypothetical protein|nr:DUF2914 domain-containing protein [Bacteroidota bacterium]